MSDIFEPLAKLTRDSLLFLALSLDLLDVLSLRIDFGVAPSLSFPDPSLSSRVRKDMFINDPPSSMFSIPELLENVLLRVPIETLPLEKSMADLPAEVDDESRFSLDFGDKVDSESFRSLCAGSLRTGRGEAMTFSTAAGFKSCDSILSSSNTKS